jgi:hypothetical protein
MSTIETIIADKSLYKGCPNAADDQKTCNKKVKSAILRAELYLMQNFLVPILSLRRNK